MELTKERAKENLSKLIEKFERELAAGRIKEYNEEATKISFIQPLLQSSGHLATASCDFKSIFCGFRPHIATENRIYQA